MKRVIRVGAALLLAVTVAGCAGPERHPDRVRTDGPVASRLDVGVSEVGGTRPGGMVDWGEIWLINSSRDSATITGVELIPGGASEHAVAEGGFFIVGLGRAFGGGLAQAPSGAGFWGAELEPAIGYQLPGPDEDLDGNGVTLVARVGVGEYEDASFHGVDVYYTWRGEEYKASFADTMLLCRADRRGQLTEKCRVGKAKSG